MKETNIQLLQSKPWYFFCVLSIFIITITYFINYQFFTERVFFNTYSSQLAFDRIEEIFNKQQGNKWIGYLLLPLLFYIKVLYNTCIVTTSSLLKDSKTNFGNNFNVCLKAEYVFIVMLFAKFFTLSFLKDVTTLDDLSYIPMSLTDLCGGRELPKWAAYPLQTINIWEILFCLVGISLYSLQFKISKAKAFQRFCIPYLIGLFIWVLIVTFIALQFS